MKLTHLALLGVATVASAQHHHAHRHVQKRGSPIEGRDAAVTQVVPAATATIYELNGVAIPLAAVEQGLKDGEFVLISGDAAPSSTTPVAPTTSSKPSPSPTPSTTSQAAAFYQKPSSSSSSSSKPQPPSTQSASPPPSPTPASSSSQSESSQSSPAASSGGSSGLNADFPSGTIPCSTFPSNYGPIDVDWLGLGGWIGVQITPNFGGNLLSEAISYIETAISGQTCTSNSFCSYACPPGYQKSQWPTSQGSTGQSIGGLYCNSNGMLELSRPSTPQLCIQGGGGIQVSNQLSSNAALCRTDYPGTESETVPLNTEPGQTYPVTNPVSADYYVWQGKPTTAQYYLNPSGASVSEACQWNSAGSNLGNWAPVNMGTGVGAGGITYMSLFPNRPTNPNGVLNYQIKITGDVSDDCEYNNGNFYMNGVEAANGCTIAVPSGGMATIVLYN